jgi:TolB-like protein/Tfp pilus assembly protein PilF
MPEDRRLVAIMFTDIVGYTALMGSDEDKAFKTLRKNREIQRPIIKKYRGEWLKEMGDGILASFQTASDAVRCAGEIQQAAKKEGIGLRIGIHEGEVVFEGGDVLGDGVNVASRLEELAEEGAVNISGAVYKDIKNKAGIETEFIEEKVLKNVEEPVKVYKVSFEVKKLEEQQSVKDKESQKDRNKLLYYIIVGLVLVIGAILIWQFMPTKDTDSKMAKDPTEVIDKSIAVLPFRNDSPDQENEYFCSGMMEAILNHLVKIRDLNVLSRTDVEPYRNTTKSRKEIAKELGVSNILEGSVQKYGNRLQITVQLINPESGFHLWSESYEGEYTENIFTIQSNIAKLVASALKAVITPEEEEMIERVPTSDIAAYDFLIRGRHEYMKYWITLDYKNLEEAHDLYDKALEIDPNFLYAIDQKGTTFMAEQNYDSAIIYADRELTIDPESYNGYGLKGECYFFLGKYDLAIENYLKAISLLSNDYKWLWWHVALGRAYSFQKDDVIMAFPYLKKGLKMSKEHLPSVYASLAAYFTNIGDYKNSEEYWQKSIELGASCRQIGYHSWTLAVQSKYKEAFHFLDSVYKDQSCEMMYYKYKFHIHLALKEFDLAEQYINQLSEAGYTFNLGDQFWVHQYLGDSVMLSYMFKELGRDHEASIILRNSKKYLESQLAGEKIWWTCLFLSFIHAIQDEKGETLRYLSEAIDLGLMLGWHDFIEVHPIFENLWDDPEFKAIVKRAQDEKADIRAQVKEMEERGELDL